MATLGITTVAIILISVATVKGLTAREGTPDGSEEWGYIPLRPGASMFYWFYKTTHPDGYLNRPLVLWLQGGPGLSGTGIGNFLEIGPLDENLNPRNSSWVESASVLFLDSPVHTGFSIAETAADIPDSIEKISNDLIRALQTFMAEHPELQNNPFHIFGQSYGGKMTAALAYYLLKEIKAGNIRCNLKTAAIGNGYVSPLDFVLQYAPVTYEMGIIDTEQYDVINKMANEVKDKTENGEWQSAVDTLNAMWDEFVPEMGVYNFLQFSRDDPNYTSVYKVKLGDFMNGPIRKKLDMVPSEKQWGKDLYRVYSVQNLSGDVLKSVWHLVDDMLKNSDIKIVVYQGQLDLICNTAGAITWMQRLTWPGLESYNSAEKRTLVNPETKLPEMFVKSYQKLKMYWVLNSGHVVPSDTPDAALRMLNRILDDVD